MFTVNYGDGQYWSYTPAVDGSFLGFASDGSNPPDQSYGREDRLTWELLF